jgi:hypothetical protein
VPSAYAQQSKKNQQLRVNQLIVCSLLAPCLLRAARYDDGRSQPARPLGMKGTSDACGGYSQMSEVQSPPG